MTEKKKRIKGDDIIARVGKMQSFSSTMLSSIVGMEQNTAYHWIRRNTGKKIGKDFDLLISWIHDDKIHGMFIPEGQKING